MVDCPPWPATELTGARPLAALVTERPPGQHGEVKEVPAKLIMDRTSRHRGGLRLAVKLSSGGWRRTARAVLGAQMGGFGA
jgi:hypothetical protein